ncbi:hypothetical protein BJP40_06450 [Streptomyces sp. CC53]|uniref:hypothetical protein n=1 Tax=Streptomyces sp. CC53 TaxID=1906740 RepID=UPI0008DD486D|nr:hypothetical protein [Streptomyces sp. CC53]OII61163.1 hypothetical protein BJP40_06450 [Streptomyces sp. CC53]
MSYARLGQSGSDVYVFMDISGHLECCLCALMPVGRILPGSFRAHCTQGMVDHLAEHEAAGHHVPDYVVPELPADDAENFPRAKGGEPE